MGDILPEQQMYTHQEYTIMTNLYSTKVPNFYCNTDTTFAFHSECFNYPQNNDKHFYTLCKHLLFIVFLFKKIVLLLYTSFSFSTQSLSVHILSMSTPLIQEEHLFGGTLHTHGHTCLLRSHTICAAT